MELLPCFAIILVIALPWWLGPIQLRPISRCPADAPSMRFALIDFASLVVLLTVLAAILKWVFRDQPRGWAGAPGLLLLFASMAMMVVAFWGHGTRCLSAHGVHDWRARVTFMLIYPLAYVMPVFSVISLCLLILIIAGEDEALWPAVLVPLLNFITWHACRAISEWVATKSTININETNTAGIELSPAPKEDPFDPFAPKKE